MAVKGFDFSSWQDAPDTSAFIDFTKAKQQADFCVARAAYGLGADRIFPRGYDEAKQAGLITGVYQFVDYRVTARANVQFLKLILNGRVPDLIAIDLEQNEAYWPGGWPSDGAKLTNFVSDYFDVYTGEGLTPPLMLYTNPDTLKQMRAAPQKLAALAAKLPLWLAWYNSNPPDPASYTPWATYHIWQPTPSAVGHQYGMESGNVDTDTWNGTLDELKAFVNGVTIPQPLTIEERLAIVEKKLKEVEQKLLDHGW